MEWSELGICKGYLLTRKSICLESGVFSVDGVFFLLIFATTFQKAIESRK